MVAIFTGEGAGLARSSANILGGAGQIGGVPLGRAGEGVSVNAATGGLILTQQDEFLAGRGLDASVARTYNSLGQTGDRDNGDNWQLSSTRRVFGFEGTLNTYGSSIKRLGADGSVLTYSWAAKNGIAAYWTTDGAGTYDRLEKSGNEWIWTDGDSKLREVYELSVDDSSEYRLKARRDIDNYQVTYTYQTGSDKLDRITTANGEWLEYSWSGDNLSSIQTGYTDLATSTSSTLTRTRYTYDAQDRLIGVQTDLSPEDELVTDGNVYTVTYTYDGTSNRVASITQTDGSQLDLTYDAIGRVLSLMHKVSVSDTRVTALAYGNGYTQVTAPDGTVTRLDYDAEGQLLQIVSPPAVAGGLNQVVQFEYDADGNLIRSIETEQAPGTPMSGGTNLVDVSGWPSDTNNVPSGSIDVAGWWNIASFTDDGQWATTTGRDGQQIVAMHTGQLDTDIQGGGNHTNTLAIDPTKAYEFSYYLKMDQLAQHTYRFAATSTHATVSGALTLSGGGDVEAAYFVNEEYLTAADGFAVDTWYKVVGYILPQGTAADPNADFGGVYDVDTGAKLRGVDHLRWNTASNANFNTVRSFFGSWHMAGNQGLYNYFDKPEVKEVESAAILSGSTNLYGGQSGSSVIYDENGRITTYQYDARGNVTRVTHPDGDYRHMYYDTNDRIVRELSFASSNSSADVVVWTKYVYDAEGHLAFMVDPEGRVTEYEYSATGLLMRTLVYPDDSYVVNQVPPSHTDMVTWRDGLADRSTAITFYYGYDARGNLIETRAHGTANSDGSTNYSDFETRNYYTYDEAGRLLSRYASGESTETFTYDGMGRMVASTDMAGGATSIVFDDAATQTVITTAAGYVTTKTYNKAGELISQTGSGNYDVGGMSAYEYDNVGRLRVTIDERGDHTYFIYDDLGRVTGTVSEDLTLSENIYDDSNRLIASVSYNTAVSASHLAALSDAKSGVTIDNIRPASDAGDLWGWTIYDSQTGNVLQTIDGTGAVTAFEYDNSERLIRTTAYANAVAVAALKTSPPLVPVTVAAHADDATSRIFYDRSGRQIGTLDSEGYLTETVYDSAGRIVEERAYAAPAATGHWANGTFLQLRSSISGYSSDAGSRSTRYVYDGRSELRYQLDDHGGVTEFIHDAAGRQTSVIAYASTLTTTDYSYANIKALTTGIANEATDREGYTIYNGNGQIAYTVSAADQVTQFEYDTSGRIIKTISFANLRSTPVLPTEAAMNSWAATAAQANDPENRISRNYYSDAGLLRFSVDAEGYVTQFIYDAEGHNTALRQYGAAISVSDTTTIAQVNSLLPTSYVEQTFVYDNLDRLSQTQSAIGTASGYTFNANGTQASTYTGMVGANSADRSESVYSYDALGRVTGMTAASGDTEATGISYAFNAFGEQVQVTDGLNRQSTFTYNDRGMLVSVTDADGGVTTYEYNAFGEVVKMTDAEGGETYSYYDELGRLTKSLDAEGYITQTDYNRFGEIENVTRYYNAFTGTPGTSTAPSVAAHAKDAVTTFTYDKAGRVVQSVDAEGFSESYAYNAFGQRESVTARSETALDADRAGNTTTYTYDRRGLLISETLPMTSVSASGAQNAASVTNTYEYDARGNRIRMTEAAGLPEERVTDYVYDDANRLVETRGQARSIWSQGTHALENGTFIPVEQLVYDARGNVTKTIDAAGNHTVHFYDDLDRKTVEVDALGTYTSYAYDKNGNVTGIKVYETQIAVPADGGSQEEQPATPAGSYRETVFTYDALNRMATSTVVLDPSTQIGSWNGSTTAPAWTSSTSGGLTTSYEYDHLGNVVKTTDPNGNETYAYYDDLSRKTMQVDSDGYITAWSYDSEGNVLTETRYAARFAGTPVVGSQPVPTATNGLDRITEYSYDLVGNRLTEKRLGVTVHNGSGTSTTVDAEVSYTYNGLGQVLTKTEATGDTITYDYDNAGRLEREERDSYIGHTGATVTPGIDYDYDGLGNLTRTVAAGAASVASRTSTYEYGAGGLLHKVTDAAGNSHEYFYDKLGRQIVDRYDRTNSAGATVTEAALSSYDALGRVTEQTVATQNGNGWIKGDVTHIAYSAFGDAIASGINKSSAAASTWQTQNRFDEAGRLYATNSGDGVWKFFGYDANGNQTAAITSAGYDFVGGLSALTFSAALAKVGQSDVNATYTGYDARNLATTVVEEDRELTASVSQDLITQRTYNAFGEVSSETDAAGATLSYTYSTAGKLIRSESPTVQITNEDGSTQWVKPSEDYYYDASGRLVATRDANGAYAAGGTSASGTSKAADSGNLTRMTLLSGTGYGGTEALVSSIVHADGGVTQTKFDIHGDARIMIDQLGRTDTQAFDALGRVTQVDHAGGLIDYFTYDEMGQQLSRWNNHYGSGNKQTTDYDLQGRVTSQRAFGGDVTTTSYSWDATLEAAGTGLTDTGGWVTTISTEADRAAYASENIYASILSQDMYGRVVSRTDKSGVGYDYTYDVAGRLTLELGGAGSRKALTYFNTGRIDTLQIGTPEVVDTSWQNKLAQYGYDAIGRVTAEKITLEKGVYRAGYYEEIMIRDWPEPEYEYNWVPASYNTYSYLQQDSEASYDALGRMTNYLDRPATGANNVDKSWTYDANGNVRSIDTDYRAITANATQSTTLSNQTLWYRYDSLNRLVVSKGLQSNGTIIAGSSGILLTYNAAGQRATAKQGYGALETYTYDQQDRVTSVQVGSLNRVTTSYNLLGQVTGHLERDASGSVVFERHSIQYSDRGQVLSEKGRRKVDRVGTSGSDWQYWHTINYYSAKGSGALMPGITSASSSGSSTGAYLFETETKNWLNGSAVPVYGSTSDTDAADTEVRLKYQWVDPTGSDGPREYKREKQSTYGTSSETFFDADGHMTAVSFSHNRNDGTYSGTNFINYETDMSGQVTYRYEGGSGSGGSSGSGESGSINERYYRFAGQAMGEIGNNGTANVDYATTIARREESGTGYFRGGDTTGTPNADFDINHVTLASSAGAGSGSGYVAQGGESLQQVARQLWGDSSLWYRLAEANGLSAGTILAAGQNIAVPAGVVSNTHNASSLQPYDPAKAIGDLTPGTLTPNPPAGKKGCGTFGIVLLAVVAIAVTVVTAGAALSATGAVSGGVFGATGGVASVLSGGALAAAGPLGAVAIGAGSAAVGSVVSQGFGVATGIQERFSWKAVGLAAIGGGVTAGLGTSFGTDWAAAGARGALTSTITQGIGAATGLQDSFGWVGVAAAGVGAAVSHVAAGVAGNSIGGRVVSNTAGGLANAATRSAIEGSSFGKNFEAALPDIIAQSLGSVLTNSFVKEGSLEKLIARNAEQADYVVDHWAKQGRSDGEKLAENANEASAVAIQQPGAQAAANPTASVGAGNSTGKQIERAVDAPIVVNGTRQTSGVTLATDPLRLGYGPDGLPPHYFMAGLGNKGDAYFVNYIADTDNFYGIGWHEDARIVNGVAKHLLNVDNPGRRLQVLHSIRDGALMDGGATAGTAEVLAAANKIYQETADQNWLVSVTVAGADALASGLGAVVSAPIDLVNTIVVGGYNDYTGNSYGGYSFSHITQPIVAVGSYAGKVYTGQANPVADAGALYNRASIAVSTYTASYSADTTAYGGLTAFSARSAGIGRTAGGVASVASGPGLARSVMGVRAPAFSSPRIDAYEAKVAQLRINVANGRAGERLVPGIGDKMRMSVPGTDRYRVVDGFRRRTNTISEVKNVAKQSLTQQLRDNIAIARSRNATFELYTRSDTDFTQPLNDAILRGDIIRRTIPGR